MAKKNGKKTKASSKDKAAAAAVKTKSEKKKTKKPTKAKAALPNGKTTKSRKPRKTGGSGVPQITITVTQDQIAARAYEVWQRNGCVSGRDYENWKQAEAELMAEVSG